MLHEILPEEIASTRQQISALQHAITICRDASMTYRAAARLPSRHREELMVMARRRSSFAQALSSFLRYPLDGNRTGSLVDRSRRWLFAARARLVGQTHLGDSLVTCFRMDDRASRALSAALELDWAVEVSSMLTTQRAEIDVTIERMRSLRGHL